MEGLSFGEQVKVILSRRNMTIKELAEQIQERAGKPMSRQNLTQRLGRDNFQEKDMRMIAAILGCPFHLSIFPTEPAEEEKVMEYANASTQNRRREQSQEQPVEERDMTIGELYEIHEELSELEKASAEEQMKEAAAVPAEEDAVQAEAVQAEKEAVETVETVEAEAEEMPAEPEVDAFETAETEPEEILSENVQTEQEAAGSEITQEETEETVQEEVPAVEAPIEEVPVEEKKDKKERFHTGGIFLRRLRRDDDAKKAEKVEVKEEPKQEKPVREVITPDSEDFEPVLKHNDAEEDLNIGEMNPYTGREYQTNSVRMHPSRIGYVQVYDRSLHQWTDMTEWAFLGYQERKKALLGKDYEPPIYLD